MVFIGPEKKCSQPANDLGDVESCTAIVNELEVNRAKNLAEQLLFTIDSCP